MYNQCVARLITESSVSSPSCHAIKMTSNEDEVVMEMRKLKTPMHPLKVIEEWRKGCSCSMDSGGNQLHPSQCEECTEAAMKAIEHYYDVTDKPPVWGDWTPAK